MKKTENKKNSKGFNNLNSIDFINKRRRIDR